MPLKISKKYILLLMVVFTLLHSIILAKFLPPLFDEAYYHSWSKYFSLGYFDHPPMVAWLEQIFSPFHGFIPSFRIASIVVSFMLLIVSTLTLRACGILNWKTFTAVYVLSQFSLAGIALKTIYTPDTPLILFWSSCLFGLIAAQRYHLSWLLFAALCFGFACISKYTAVLLGPCILFTLYTLKNRRNFKVYLTGSILLFCLSVAPHVYWLSNHQFVSVTAQLSHGLSGKVQSSLKEDSFPKIKSSSQAIQLIKDALRKIEHPDFQYKKTKFKILKIPSRIGEVFGGLAILWGGFLFLIFGQWFFSIKTSNKLEPETRQILKVATVFPFVFFCFTSLFAKVEVNWLSIVIPGLLPIASQFLQHRTKAMCAVAAFHILISLVLITHVQKPFLSLKKDRLLYETKGYQELTQRPEIKDTACFAHSYQMASMLNFYGQTDDTCIPYLGYARFSQYDLKFKDLKLPEHFHFLTHHPLGSQPDGYQLVDTDIMFICKHLPPIVLNPLKKSRLEKPCDYSHYFLKYEFKKTYATPR